MMSLNEAIDEFMKLDYASREMLLEILGKRQAEERRKEIARNSKKAKAGFKAGKLKATSAKNAIKHLHKMLEK